MKTEQEGTELSVSLSSIERQLDLPRRPPSPPRRRVLCPSHTLFYFRLICQVELGPVISSQIG